MFDKLLTQFHTLRVARIHKASRYSALMEQVPGALYPYWKTTAHHEFTGIPRDAFFFARALDGLFTFFDCTRLASRPCALPSAAADSVWHAWIRMDPDGLDNFCIRHFGRKIAHVEAAAMPGAIDLALAVSLVKARMLDNLPTAGPRVPRLFALDRELGMPNGYDYRVQNGEVGFGRMDEAGNRRGSLVFPTMLTAHRLFCEGLITQEAYAKAVRQPRQMVDSGGGGSFGSVCAGESACDSAGDGGSSCGGGCGGD